MTPAQTKIREWRNNPVLFVKENFGASPDPWQVDALVAYGSREAPRLRLALKACVGPGKTCVLAWIGWHFLATCADVGEHPKGYCVSITKDNLKDNLWPEFAKWQSKSPFLMAAFTWTKQRIFANDHPETWFLAARSWSRRANPEELGRVLSGLHSKNVLVLIDESGDIPIAIIKAADQALSNCWFGRIVQGGNPTSHTGMLYLACTKLRDLWKIITVTGDPESPKAWWKTDRHPKEVGDWAVENIKEYGRDDPWIMATVLGLFPPGGINALLGLEDVEEAMARHLTLDEYAYAQKRLGIDVADSGVDMTVIFPRQGLRAFKYVPMRSQYGPDIAARVVKAKIDWAKKDKENFETPHDIIDFWDDTGGWAGSALDSMQAGGYSPVPVNFAGKANDPRYYNKRAEMYFEMAKWVKRGGALPYDTTLIKELTMPTYSFKDGRFLMQPKDQIKKLLGFSPDRADSLCLTFAQPEMPARARIPGVSNQSNTLLSEYEVNLDD